jgi:hypothetical protein
MSLALLRRIGAEDCDKTNEVVRLIIAFLKISLLLNSAAQSVLQLEDRDATHT